MILWMFVRFVSWFIFGLTGKERVRTADRHSN